MSSYFTNSIFKKGIIIGVILIFIGLALSSISEAMLLPAAGLVMIGMMMSMASLVIGFVIFFNKKSN